MMQVSSNDPRCEQHRTLWVVHSAPQTGNARIIRGVPHPKGFCILAPGRAVATSHAHEVGAPEVRPAERTPRLRAVRPVSEGPQMALGAGGERALSRIESLPHGCAGQGPGEAVIAFTLSRTMEKQMNEFSVWPSDVTDWMALIADDLETEDSYQQSAIAAEQSMNANGSRG